MTARRGGDARFQDLRASTDAAAAVPCIRCAPVAGWIAVDEPFVREVQLRVAAHEALDGLDAQRKPWRGSSSVVLLPARTVTLPPVRSWW